MVEELNPELDLDLQAKAIYECIVSLQNQNLSRYENQARLLLQNFALSVQGDGYQIEYKIKGDGCSSELSTDGGENFRPLGWGRIESSSSGKVKNLIQIFAESESRALLNN